MDRVRISLVCLVGAVLALMQVASTEEANADSVPGSRKGSSTDWPRWRGPNADGVVEGRNLPLRWNKTENVLWSVKLPGWGTSSPVVFGDRVFVTSQHQARGKKALLTLCFDRKTGEERWRHD